MTETSPVGTLNVSSPLYDTLDDAARYARKRINGRPCFGVDAKIVDPQGSRLCAGRS